MPSGISHISSKTGCAGSSTLYKGVEVGEAMQRYEMQEGEFVQDEENFQ